MLLVIMDEEEEYLEGLSHYFQECFNKYYEIYAFQNKEALQYFAHEKGKEIAVFLGSIYLTPKEVEELKIQQFIYLSAGDKIAETQTEQKADIIYKYQPAEAIVKEFLQVCKFANSKTAGNLTKQVKLYGVYSPVSRCGKTSLALTMGILMAEEKHTLYVSLEEWPGFERILGAYQGMDISDLIYYSRQGKQNLGMYLNGMLQVVKKLMILPPVKRAPDIQELTQEEFLEFLQELIQTGEFDAIIIDFGNQIRQVLASMEQLEKLYMPTLKDSISRAKQEEFLSFIENSNYEKQQDKIVVCKMSLSNKRNCENVEELSNGSFGAYVRELLEEER